MQEESMNATIVQKNITRCLVSGIISTTAVVMAQDDVPTVIANGFRQFVNTNKTYRVETDKITEQPSWVADSLMFAFDCTKTNGWTIIEDNKVTKIPTLVTRDGYKDRFLTVGISSELGDPYAFSAYRFYYGAMSTANPGVLSYPDASDRLTGPYLDFGAAGSKKGLFFDKMNHEWKNGSYSGTEANVMTGIGTVVGVYKSYGGTGNLLAGSHYKRYTSSSSSGTNLWHGIIRYNCDSPLKKGAIWSNLTKDASDIAKWTGDWQIVVANPETATLKAYGVGFGDVNDPDRKISSGGQGLAELMLFDRVLTESETREIVIYLNHKWLGRNLDNKNGEGSVNWLVIGDCDKNKERYPSDDTKTVTFDVPANERLSIGRIEGGRGNGSASPTVAKTGAGTMTVNGAENFGGTVAVREGTLKFTVLRPVPTLGDLAPHMVLHLDPADAASLTVSDGAVCAMQNKARYAIDSGISTALEQTNEERRPILIPDALGGKAVLDFGGYGSAGKYLKFTTARSYQTIVAVVDARIYGGGNVLSAMFRHCSYEDLSKNLGWNSLTLSRLLDVNGIYASDFIDYLSPNECGDVWVNGARIEKGAAGNEVPAWQIVAWRVPGSRSDPMFLGAGSSSAAGGLRIGEVLGWGVPLADEEIADAVAYLMKKWLGRTPAGYSDGTGVPLLQKLCLGGATAQVEVPEGVTAKVDALKTDGRAVKTGKGILAVVKGGSLVGGIEIREGGLSVAEGPDVASNCEVAVNPALHLDASDKASLCFLDGETHEGLSYIWNWQDKSGRIAALLSDASINKGRRPYLNTNTVDLCNGLPTVDFGVMNSSWNNGSSGEARFLGLSRVMMNIRSVYMVYGSQEGGGQPLGQRHCEGIEGDAFTVYEPYDFLRTLSETMTRDEALRSPLYGTSASSNVKNGELWINGVKQSAVTDWVPSGGYDLVELHTAGGCMADALASGRNFYMHGGCRLGEVIIFERTLSDREKTATRNYLLKKWFAKRDAELADLPVRTSHRAFFSGDLSYAAGAVWNVEVWPDGTADVLAVTGNMSFGFDTVLNLTGLGSFTHKQLRNLKLVVGRAGSFVGVENIQITGDVELPVALTPCLRMRSNGDLVVRFGGDNGFVMTFR